MQVLLRETPEWKMHAADLEAEMLRRGMIFDVIDWSEDLFCRALSVDQAVLKPVTVKNLAAS